MFIYIVNLQNAGSESGIFYVTEINTSAPKLFS